MPSYSATLYIEPSTIEQITVNAGDDINISRSSVSGNYGVFTTTSIGWDGESSKQITISADGYNNYTGTLSFNSGKAMKWYDFYATMTEAVPKYVSNLSDGTNTYIIKDANAADKDLSNLTATGKETIVGLGMPDYENATVPISFPFVAPSNGIVKLSFVVGTASYALVNSLNPVGRIGSRLSGNWIIQDLVVSKGDVVTITGNYTASENCFIPYKGG